MKASSSGALHIRNNDKVRQYIISALSKITCSGKAYYNKEKKSTLTDSHHFSSFTRITFFLPCVSRVSDSAVFLVPYPFASAYAFMDRYDI
jgi:hypothetical protein